MLPATPQRTAEKRSLAPTPMIADEITWVVETGIPKVDAPDDDRGRGRLGREPVDRVELHDPLAHRLDDPPAARRGPERDRTWRPPGSTHSGTVGSASTPPATSARVMMPIVFWASFEPWLKAMYAAEIT